MKRLILSIILYSCVFPGLTFGQFDPDASIDTDIRPPDVIIWQTVSGNTLPDGRIKIGLRLITKDDFTLYTTKVKFAGPSGFKVVDKVTPKTRRITDPITLNEVDVYEAGAFELTFWGPDAFKGQAFPVNITYIGCTSKICLFPYTEKLAVPVFASSDQGKPQGAGTKQPAAGTALAAADAGKPTSPDQAVMAGEEVACTPTKDFSALAATITDEDKDLETAMVDDMFAEGALSMSFMTLLLIFLAGIGTNFTPCVAPMIPITIRLLANQGGSSVLNSTVYAAGIVVTYSTLGIAAAATGSMFGSFMQLAWVNVVFALIMGALAFTMIGFGDFSKIQMLGNRLGTGKSSLGNTFLMGTGAGLVASPCTGPALATLLAYTAKSGDFTQGSVTILLYSLGFGLPYILLGSFAAKASAVKVSPKVQVGVKLVFAAIMFCLAFYYLRVPLVDVMAAFKSQWAVISGIILPIGLGLMALWLLVPRLQNDKVLATIPTLILGLGIFSATQWYSLVDTSYAANQDLKLTWFKTEKAAYAHAKQCGKPVLVDMWAEWCEACKKMDKTTFQDPRVRQVLGSNWVLLKLDLTESIDENDEIQERYELQSLPTLVLVPPSGELDEKSHIMGYVTAGALIEKLLGYRME